MAVIEKRGESYRARITRKGHPRESATFPTRGRAQAWATKREAELLTAKHGGIIRRTVRQALEKYRDEVAPLHRGAHWEQIRCNKLARELEFAARPLSEVNSRDIAAWRDNSPLAPGSIKREMGILRLVFERCRLEWGWLSSNPMDGVARPKEPPARKRSMSAAELERFLTAAAYVRGSKPETIAHRVAIAVLFALETAMRAGEICGLGPESVTGRHAILPRTKNGDQRDVPLSLAALELWALIPEGLGLNVRQLDVHFRKIRDAAGIVGLHFHDTRATAVTRLSKILDVRELANMIGHRDLNSLLIYYRPDPDDIAKRLD